MTRRLPSAAVGHGDRIIVTDFVLGQLRHKTGIVGRRCAWTLQLDAIVAVAQLTLIATDDLHLIADAVVRAEGLLYGCRCLRPWD